ncbi:unnamed protein product [Caenorhabditis sp. 36 PRJEB53466]|nr:unnamed protein product [Caenorhabditis sp. 36 PRJEB53466]
MFPPPADFDPDDVIAFNSLYFTATTLCFPLISLGVYFWFFRNGTSQIFPKFIHFHVLMWISLICIVFIAVSTLLSTLLSFYARIVLAFTVGFLVMNGQILLTVAFIQTLLLFTKMPEKLDIFGFAFDRKRFIGCISAVLFVLEFAFIAYTVTANLYVRIDTCIADIETKLILTMILTIGVFFGRRKYLGKCLQLSGDKIPYLINGVVILTAALMCQFVNWIVVNTSSLMLHYFINSQTVMPFVWLISAWLTMQPKVLAVFRTKENPVELDQVVLA